MTKSAPSSPSPTPASPSLSAVPTLYLISLHPLPLAALSWRSPSMFSPLTPSSDGSCAAVSEPGCSPIRTIFSAGSSARTSSKCLAKERARKPGPQPTSMARSRRPAGDGAGLIMWRGAVVCEEEPSRWVGEGGGGVVELEVGERWYARRMSMMRGGYDLSFLQPVPFTLRGDRR